MNSFYRPTEIVVPTPPPLPPPPHTQFLLRVYDKLMTQILYNFFYIYIQAPNAQFHLSLVGEEAAPFRLLEEDFNGIGTVDIRVTNTSLLDYEKTERFDFMVCHIFSTVLRKTGELKQL